MDSRRQLKVASLIKEAFATVLTREGKKIYGTAFVTVTNAKVTSDLSLVRFYLSVYNSPNPDEVIEKIEEHKHELKRALTEEIRHDVRRIPEVTFFRDETMDYVFHIEDVFKKIKEEDEQLKSELSKKTDNGPATGERKKVSRPRKKK